METRHKVVLVLGLAVLAALLVRACPPPVYFGARISGRITDAETEQPLEGVVVVATWCMITLGWGHTGPPWPLRLAEAVTDKDGQYVIAAWGPTFHVPWAWLWGYDPALYFFKAGYKPERRSNEHISSALVSKSDWNGAPIALAPFRGTPAERLIELGHTFPMCGSGRKGVPSRLCDEILKEQALVGPKGQLFFENVQRLREGR